MKNRDSHDGTARRGDRGPAAAMKHSGGASGDVVGVASPPSPLPVFLFPTELVFDAEQRETHRRLLTLYNPYSFRIRFKMLCTAPSLYRVVEAEGSVRAKSCVDLVVRHLDVSPRNWGRRDRFRMEVRGGGQVGEREIWAELRGGGGDEEEEKKRSKRGGRDQQRALSPLSPLLVPTHTHTKLPACTAVHSVSQWVVCVTVAMLCVTVLMLPLHTEDNSMVPPCLHVSANQKLVCAYTLGLLTMVFLR